MARPTFSSPRHQAELDRFGCTLLDLLDPSDLDALRALWGTVGPAPDDPARAMHFGFFSDEPSWKRKVHDGVLDVFADRLQACFDDQAVYFTMFVTKWPGDLGAFAPHQDPSFVDERHHRTVTVWCPLEATGPDNGQLHLVPGSHLLGPSVRVNDTSRFAHRASEQEILDHMGVAVPTRPGQCVVFDNRTVHYSGTNRTDVPRVVMAIGLRPTEAACFHFELAKDDPEMVDVVPIDEDYFVRMNPLRLQVQGLGDVPRRRIPAPGAVTSEQLRTAVDAAGSPPFARPAQLHADWDLRYCFVCGSTERLLVDPAGERGGMAVCEGCIVEVIDRYAPTERHAETDEAPLTAAAPQPAPPSVSPPAHGPGRFVGGIRSSLRRLGDRRRSSAGRS